jgi:Mn2+/Fe2+ NRAMP family transporter
MYDDYDTKIAKKWTKWYRPDWLRWSCEAVVLGVVAIACAMFVLYQMTGVLIWSGIVLMVYGTSFGAWQLFAWTQKQKMEGK